MEKVADVILGLVEAFYQGVLSKRELVKSVLLAAAEHRKVLEALDHALDEPKKAPSQP